MLQQFSDDLEVGWHPEYRELMAAADTGAAADSRRDRGADAAQGSGDVPAGSLADQLPPDVPTHAARPQPAPPRPARARRRRQAGAE